MTKANSKPQKKDKAPIPWLWLSRKGHRCWWWMGHKNLVICYGGSYAWKMVLKGEAAGNYLEPIAAP